MARQEVKDEGAFTKRNKKACNDNFTALYASGLAAGAIIGPASSTDGGIVTYDGTTGLLAKDSTVTSASVVVGPASVTSGKVAVFSGTTGKLLAANSTGATAGPFTTITAIQVVNGLVTTLTGS